MKLVKRGLVLASSAEKPRETDASTSAEVADSTTGAVTAGLISVAIKGISAGRAFL